MPELTTQTHSAECRATRSYYCICRKRVASFPLSDAALCLDCETVFRLTGSGGRCPCSSESIVSLGRFLNRASPSVPFEQDDFAAGGANEPASGGMVPA